MIARITGEASLLGEAQTLAENVRSMSALFPWYSGMALATRALVAEQRGEAQAAQVL